MVPGEVPTCESEPIGRRSGGGGGALTPESAPVLHIAAPGQSVADDHAIVLSIEQRAELDSPKEAQGTSGTYLSLSFPQVLNATGTSRRTTPLSKVNSETTAMDWDGIKAEKRFAAESGGEPGGWTVTARARLA